MAGNTSLWQVFANALKERFVTLSGGAFILMFSYIWWQERIDAVILDNKEPEITYLAVVVMVMSFSFFISMLSGIYHDIFLPFTEQWRKERKFEKELKGLNTYELKLVKEHVLHNAHNSHDAPTFHILKDNVEQIDSLRKYKRVNSWSSCNRRIDGKDYPAFRFYLSGFDYDLQQNKSYLDIIDKYIKKSLKE